MSEFFEQSAGIQKHLEGVDLQLKALKSRTDIPQGDHVDLVLGMADLGGVYSGVLLQGDQGSGKTSIMNAIIGEDCVIGIDPGDEVQTLLGYEKPTGESTYAAGKIGALVIASNGDIRIGLDELGQIENARPLHRIFNGSGFTIHDGTKRFETSSMAVIASSNYVNVKGGVYPIHKELRSRFGGGFPLESPEIPSPGKRNRESGLLAPTKVRQDLREYMEEKHPEHKTAKTFTNKLVRNLAETGLFEPIPADARIMGGLLHAVRAKRLVTQEIDPDKGVLKASDARPITLNDIADVAAFNLGKTAELNKEGINTFSTALGGERLSEHAKAVIQNRFVAGMAKKTNLDMFDGSTKHGKSSEEKEKAVRIHILETSYATSMDLNRYINEVKKEEILDEIIIKMLFAKKKEAAVQQPEQEQISGRKSILSRATSRFRTS